MTAWPSGKAIAAGLSLDIDIGPTRQLNGFIGAGIAGGFDGQTLFFEDVVRSAPMDPASTVPDATNVTPFLSAKTKKVEKTYLAKAAAGAARIKEKFSGVALLDDAMNRRETFIGSNEWGVAGDKTEDGHPMIANDPHLSLNIPSTFYEWHLVVQGDPVDGDMNVSGVGFPGHTGRDSRAERKGNLGRHQQPDGCERHLPATRSPAFLGIPLPHRAASFSDGMPRAVTIDIAQYFANNPGSGTPNDVNPIPLPLEQSLIATVALPQLRDPFWTSPIPVSF